MFTKKQIENAITIICDGICEGKSLRSICRDNHGDDFPSMSSVIKWLANADIKGRDSEYYEFLRQYTHAREVQADTLVDELLDIADDTTNDYSVDENGKKIVDHEHLQRSRLRVDTRKWIAGKQRPKKYSDKLDISQTITIQDISDDDLENRIKQLLGDVK